jgi:hypothetical protein
MMSTYYPARGMQRSFLPSQGLTGNGINYARYDERRLSCLLKNFFITTNVWALSWASWPFMSMTSRHVLFTCPMETHPIPYIRGLKPRELFKG